MTKEKMLERAKALGIKVDGRWSDFRLAQEIEKAEAAAADEAIEAVEAVEEEGISKVEQPTKLVKMFRARDEKLADVHPDSVGDYVKADYVVKAD